MFHSEPAELLELPWTSSRDDSECCGQLRFPPECKKHSRCQAGQCQFASTGRTFLKWSQHSLTTGYCYHVSLNHGTCSRVLCWKYNDDTSITTNRHRYRTYVQYTHIVGLVLTSGESVCCSESIKFQASGWRHIPHKNSPALNITSAPALISLWLIRLF